MPDAWVPYEQCGLDFNKLADPILDMLQVVSTLYLHLLPFSMANCEEATFQLVSMSLEQLPSQPALPCLLLLTRSVIACAHILPSYAVRAGAAGM